MQIIFGLQSGMYRGLPFIPKQHVEKIINNIRQSGQCLASICRKFFISCDNCSTPEQNSIPVSIKRGKVTFGYNFFYFTAPNDDVAKVMLGMTDDMLPVISAKNLEPFIVYIGKIDTECRFVVADVVYTQSGKQIVRDLFGYDFFPVPFTRCFGMIQHSSSRIILLGMIEKFNCAIIPTETDNLARLLWTTDFCTPHLKPLMEMVKFLNIQKQKKNKPNHIVYSGLKEKSKYYIHQDMSLFVIMCLIYTKKGRELFTIDMLQEFCNLKHVNELLTHLRRYDTTDDEMIM